MPLPSSVLGLTGEPIHHHVDLRWVLSYSAGIGDTSSAVFAQDAVAHPLFMVCPEWPSVLSVRRLGLTPDEERRGVHASHDVIIHRPVRAGDDLTTIATIVGVEAGRAGAATWLRLATVDPRHEPVATTYQRNVLLGVELQGEPGSIDGPPPIPERLDSFRPTQTLDLPVGPQEAHIYTECSHIWNPIHTEWKAAEDAGLAFLLLHGTATLAKAVSAVDDMWGDGQRNISRVISRFAAPVPMPTTLRVSASSDGAFEATLPDGSVVLRDGRVFWN